MAAWEESYVGRVRSLTGSRALLIPGARAFIRDDDDRTLFIRRRDNGHWAFPAGTMELGETVLETLAREVREETGLAVVSATLIATYSGPRMAGVDQWGNENHYVLFQFRVDEWTGTLVRETYETVDAGFFSETELPEAYERYRESFDDLGSFSGQVILK